MNSIIPQCELWFKPTVKNVIHYSDKKSEIHYNDGSAEILVWDEVEERWTPLVEVLLAEKNPIV